MLVAVLIVLAIVLVAAVAICTLNALQNSGDDTRLAVVTSRTHRAPFAAPVN